MWLCKVEVVLLDIGRWLAMRYILRWGLLHQIVGRYYSGIQWNWVQICVAFHPMMIPMPNAFTDFQQLYTWDQSNASCTVANPQQKWGIAHAVYTTSSCMASCSWQYIQSQWTFTLEDIGSLNIIGIIIAYSIAIFQGFLKLGYRGTPNSSIWMNGIFQYKPSSYWGTPIYGTRPLWWCCQAPTSPGATGVQADIPVAFFWEQHGVGRRYPALN